MLFHKLADVFFFIDADVTAEQIANPAITQRRQLTYQRLVHSIDSALDKNNYDALQLPRKKHIICSKAVDKQNKIEYNLKFSNQPPPPEGRQASQDILKNKPGVKGSAKNVKTPKDAFDLFFTDKICKKIVFYTNKHVEKTLSNLPPDTDYSKCPYLKEIDTEDLHATIGLMYFRGLFNQNCRLLFGDKYGQPVFSATMSRNRFLFIVANLRFDDEETRPNRWKKDRFTALREIFEDCNNNFAKHLVPEDFIIFETCHHQIAYAKFDLKVYLPPPYKREVWTYDKAEVELIRRAITSFDWVNSFFNLGTSEQVDLFNTTLLNIFRNFIPHKYITCRYKVPPWITNEIKTALRKKNRLYKKYIKNGRNIEDLNTLNNFSTIYTELVSSSKKTYFEKLANKIRDPHLGPKAYWSILNGFLGKVKIPSIPPLLVDSNFETNFLNKANIFNNHFANQCTTLNNGSFLPNVLYKTNGRINNISINSDIILKVVNDLNPSKAHGWDGISIRMIKMCGESIVFPLMIIFENAIETGVYPAKWKRGNIVPVHKKEGKNLVKNYRPISLLPIFGKIFEKVIYNSLFEYLKSNDILNKCQSGFLPGDSCISQLLCITHDIYNAFDGNPSLEVRGVFLDISKAFDRVWHEGLLHKLKCYGVEGKLYYVLENYLTDRKQRVVLNGQNSEWADVKAAGVPPRIRSWPAPFPYLHQ